MIRYQVRPLHPGTHLFQVHLRVARPEPGGQSLSLPAWIPGSYKIRDYARHVVRLEARSSDGPLHPVKQDKQTWRLPACSGPLEIEYVVYAWDLSVRGAHCDQRHAYFNGPALLLRPHGRDHLPCTIEIQRPAQPAARDWQVATSLAPEAVDGDGFGRYRAEDYADLIDHPVEMGRLDRVRFAVRGVPHFITVNGRHHGDLDRLARDLAAICEAEADLFGELPLDRYGFLIQVTGEDYGGLEHRDSCSLICARHELPRPGLEAPDEAYRRLLGLCAHEYFHLWHVKRIRPLAFQRGGLEAEVHTRLLWVFEGITSYYDDLMLVRSGRITARAYLDLLAHTLTRVWRGSGRFKQSLAESGFDAWTRFYQQDENAPNAIVSYYAKGALVALALDLHLRLRAGTDLDRIMRTLWERHGRTGEGLPEEGFERLTAEVAGIDLSDFFAHYVHGTADPPLEELLAAFGVALHLRPRKDAKDQGGAVDAFAPAEVPPWLGLDHDGASPPRVTRVYDGGPAQSAGIAPGDRLLALDGVEIRAAMLPEMLQAIPGPRRLHLFRGDELLELEVTPAEPPADTCELRLEEGDPAACARRREWLRES